MLQPFAKCLIIQVVRASRGVWHKRELFLERRNITRCYITRQNNIISFMLFYNNLFHEKRCNFSNMLIYVDQLGPPMEWL